MKYVLIACEESQTECIAFRQAGAAAFSCDIKACSGNHPEWHIRDDVTPFLKGRRYFKTCDGVEHHVPQWDLIIAHPPCTYLARSGFVRPCVRRSAFIRGRVICSQGSQNTRPLNARCRVICSLRSQNTRHLATAARHHTTSSQHPPLAKARGGERLRLRPRFFLGWRDV